MITPLKNLVNGFFLRTWHSVIIWFGLFNQYCQKYQRCHLPSIKIFDTVDYSLNWNLSNNFSLIYYNSYLTHFIITNNSPVIIILIISYFGNNLQMIKMQEYRTSTNNYKPQYLKLKRKCIWFPSIKGMNIWYPNENSGIKHELD